ncbi:MAG: hypothetical protein KGL39_37350 [Patescibacteria group bacterium]|nr:hypothetical protein [Patescibacteria group bacterium]
MTTIGSISINEKFEIVATSEDGKVSEVFAPFEKSVPVQKQKSLAKTAKEDNLEDGKPRFIVKAQAGEKMAAFFSRRLIGDRVLQMVANAGIDYIEVIDRKSGTITKVKDNGQQVI